MNYRVAGRSAASHMYCYFPYTVHVYHYYLHVALARHPLEPAIQHPASHAAMAVASYYERSSATSEPATLQPATMHDWLQGMTVHVAVLQHCSTGCSWLRAESLRRTLLVATWLHCTT